MGNEDLQKEWREIVIKRLDSLQSGQEAIKEDISDMKINMTSPTIINTIETRLRDLENFKERALTLFFVIQALVGVGMVILQHYWK